MVHRVHTPTLLALILHLTESPLLVGFERHSPDSLDTSQDIGVFTGAYTQTLGQHSSAALRITPVHKHEHDVTWRPWHQQSIYSGVGTGPGHPAASDDAQLSPHAQGELNQMVKDGRHAGQTLVSNVNGPHTS